MSCEWCKNIKSIKDKSIWDVEEDDGTILHRAAARDFWLVVGGCHKHPIKYCPNCGKKLKREE